jgi:hypothetical protein
MTPGHGVAAISIKQDSSALDATYKLYRFSYVSNVADLATLGGALRDVLDT